MSARHPDQPLIEGRFKANPIVQYLLDNGAVGVDMNHLALMDFSDEDRQQFAQLIGYSLGGYGDLGYVSDEAYERAAAQTYADVPWDGEGLPPVGAVCEVSTPQMDGSRIKVIIRFVGEERIVAHDGEAERCWLIKNCQFRPIRKPEQIAADEREAAGKELYLTINWNDTAESWDRIGQRRDDYLKAIDAGYRKQVAP